MADLGYVKKAILTKPEIRNFFFFFFNSFKHCLVMGGLSSMFQSACILHLAKCTTVAKLSHNKLVAGSNEDTKLFNTAYFKSRPFVTN